MLSACRVSIIPSLDYVTYTWQNSDFTVSSSKILPDFSLNPSAVPNEEYFGYWWKRHHSTVLVFLNGVAPTETMMMLDKSCWLFENSRGKHTKRTHSFQNCNIMELYLWTTTWASSDLQSTANHNFRDLHKSLTHRCEADASREALNSHASGLPVKKKTKFFSTSLCKTNCDSEYLNHGLKFFPSLQPTVFSTYSSTASLTEQDMSWYLQNVTNQRIFFYTLG